MKVQLRSAAGRMRNGSILTVFALAALTFDASAQIDVSILEPEAAAGALEFTWSETWGADLNDAANIVTGNVILADDGTAADSLACFDLVNGDQMSGPSDIVMLYRGDCEFGAKALNAQNAGAEAVVIVNNISGAPVGMGVGAVGDQVTIPVVMISDASGAMIRDLLAAGPVVMRIGTLLGFYPYNLALRPRGIELPPSAAVPQLLAQESNAIDFTPGAWVFNFGNLDQSNAQLQVTITQDGTEVYNEISDPTAVPAVGGASPDSVFIALSPFTQASYSGHYVITYTLVSDQTDEFPENDQFVTSLHIGDVFSYAEVDPTTGVPITEQWASPSTNVSGFRSCIHFSDPNASLVAVTGLHVNLSTFTDSVFEGNQVNIQAQLWDTDVVDLENVPADDQLFIESEGEHFLVDSEMDQTIFIPFNEPVMLLDDAHYLFCLITNDVRTRHGFDDRLDYLHNETSTDFPIQFLRLNEGGWFFFSDVPTPPSIGMETVDATLIGMDENNKIEITPFPNPTADQIRIPLAGQNGAALLEIFDMAGAKVADRQVNVGGEQVVVDMKGISNGTYMFNMVFEDGRRSNFRVVVSR